MLIADPLNKMDRLLWIMKHLDDYFVIALSLIITQSLNVFMIWLCWALELEERGLCQWGVIQFKKALHSTVATCKCNMVIIIIISGWTTLNLKNPGGPLTSQSEWVRPQSGRFTRKSVSQLVKRNNNPSPSYEKRDSFISIQINVCVFVWHCIGVPRGPS